MGPNDVVAVAAPSRGEQRYLRRATRAWREAFAEARRLRKTRLRIQGRREQRILTVCWDYWSYVAWDSCYAREEVLRAAQLGQESDGRRQSPPREAAKPTGISVDLSYSVRKHSPEYNSQSSPRSWTGSSSTD